MMKIKVICIGKLKETYLKDAFFEYKKRLQAFCKFELVELDEVKIESSPHSSEIEKCINSEGEKIISKIKAGSYTIALCIEGKLLSSEQFAKHINDISVNKTGDITFIIGSSYGLSESVKKKSDFLLSFSPMTFPHQLSRVMLCEQIYRAFEILSGGKYHK